MLPLYHQSFPNASGIYCITCIPTGKIYVGSAINLRRRRKTHFGHLQRNQHRNPKLQAAWNKYGPDAFRFDILELILLPEMLIVREQHWFAQLNPFGNNGFNLNPIAGSSLGRVVSQASREKSRQTQLGRPSARIGWKPSPEQVEHHRRAILGKKHTEETKRKMVEAHTGQKHNSKTREKIRLAALGHAPTNAKTFIVTSPDGTEFVVHGLRKLCREHGLNSSTLVQVARGNRKHHKGWIARYYEENIS